MKAIGDGININLTGEEIMEYRFKYKAPNRKLCLWNNRYISKWCSSTAFHTIL